MYSQRAFELRKAGQQQEEEDEYDPFESSHTISIDDTLPYYQPSADGAADDEYHPTFPKQEANEDEPASTSYAYAPSQLITRDHSFEEEGKLPSSSNSDAEHYEYDVDDAASDGHDRESQYSDDSNDDIAEPMDALEETLDDEHEDDEPLTPNLLLNGQMKRIPREMFFCPQKKTGGLLTVNMNGVASVLGKLRGSECTAEEKQRITLDYFGNEVHPPRDPTALPVCRISEVVQRVALAGDNQEACDLPPPPPHPTDVNAVRKLIRSKMVRCKRCKNRFVEKNIYERHLRDRHPKDYEEYIAEQEAEMEQQRQEELEANRIEELQTGGFIPPAEDINSSNYEVVVDGIPLPGENNGGVAPRFDSFGAIKAVRRPYKKKVSPQCPFCDKRFRNEYSLKKHILKKHEECAEFVQCNKCFKCCPDRNDLAAHECELTYVCFECTPVRNLCTDQRLLNHRRKFHRGANSGFKCNLCNLKFLTPRKLRKHKKMSHVFTKTYQCHFCDEIFISEVSVMTHERIHTGIIKFECKICDFKCNRFIQMEDHMKYEHGYICGICKAKFAEFADLKNHTLTDHGGYLTTDSSTGYIESPRVWLMFKGE